MSEIDLKLELEQEIERLKEENKLLKQKESERTKINMDAECACIYTNINGSYLYGEPEQLDRLLENCSDLTYAEDMKDGDWGSSIEFISIASAKTCLLRNGYKFSYVSAIPYVTAGGTGAAIVRNVENWVKGV